MVGSSVFSSFSFVTNVSCVGLLLGLSCTTKNPTVKLSRQTSKGFTLVELLLYMGLLSAFLLVLTDILVSALDVKTEGTASGFVASEANYLRERIRYDIRRATALSSPANPGENGASFGLLIGGSTTTYALSDDVLELTVNGATQRLHSDATRVSNFVATRVGNGTNEDTLVITFRLESTALLRGQPAQMEEITVSGGLR